MEAYAGAPSEVFLTSGHEQSWAQCMYCNQMVHAEELRFPRGGPRGFTKTYAF